MNKLAKIQKKEKRKKGWLENVSIYATIISTVIALISLILSFIQPKNETINIYHDKFPYIAFFFFIFAIVTVFVFLINKMSEKIGNISIGGDVVMANNIGDYIEKNYDGMNEDEVSKLIEALSKKDELVLKVIESKSDLTERIISKNSDLTADIISKNNDLNKKVIDSMNNERIIRLAEQKGILDEEGTKILLDKLK